MAFNTRDIRTEGSGKMSKTIRPGNVTAKILKLSLQPQKSNPDNEYLVLHVETEPIGGDFEGFWYDPNNQALGRAKGQVGRVRFSQYAYTDGVTKTGRKKNKIFDMVADIARLADALGVRAELNAIEGDEKNFAKFIDDASKVLNNGKYLYMCVGGSAYMNREGMKDYVLNLPKYSREYVGFEPAGTTPSKVAVFDYNTFVEDSTGAEDRSAPAESVVSWGSAPAADPAPAPATSGWAPTEFEL